LTDASASSFASAAQVQLGEENDNALDSGACALAAYLRGDTIWVANAGDCRAVLGTLREGVLSAVALSTDHKPDGPNEAARIAQSGGYVRPASGEAEDFRPARLYEDEHNQRLGPGLAMSRALGDINAERCGFIAVPEVISHTVRHIPSPHPTMLHPPHTGLAWPSDAARTSAAHPAPPSACVPMPPARPPRTRRTAHPRPYSPSLALIHPHSPLFALPRPRGLRLRSPPRQVDPEYDLYLILASDGVWEFISPAQAVDIVHGAIEDGGAPSDACRTACRQLIAHAALEWRTQEGDYRDDISATVLWLPDMVRFLQSRTPDVAPAAA
jgi:serine/threonine protein phosphatase PrpC